MKNRIIRNIKNFIAIFIILIGFFIPFGSILWIVAWHIKCPATTILKGFLLRKMVRLKSLRFLAKSWIQKLNK